MRKDKLRKRHMFRCRLGFHIPIGGQSGSGVVCANCKIELKGSK